MVSENLPPEEHANAEVDFSSFDVKNFQQLAVGEYFIWAGSLYQKTEICFVQAEKPKSQEWTSRNAVQVTSGKLFYYFDEESTCPVKIMVKVRQ